MLSMISIWTCSSKSLAPFHRSPFLTSPPSTLPPANSIMTLILLPPMFSLNGKPLIPVVSDGGTKTVQPLLPLYTTPLVNHTKQLSNPFAAPLLLLNANGPMTSSITPPLRTFGKLLPGAKATPLNAFPPSLLLPPTFQTTTSR